MKKRELDVGNPRNVDTFNVISARFPNGKWYDAMKETTYPFICEVPPTMPNFKEYCPNGWTYFEITNKCYQVSKPIFFYLLPLF